MINQINKDHAEAIAKLNKEKENEIKTLIGQFQNDPNKMAESVYNLLGIPIQK
jgi:gas vesicle protein